MEPSRWKQIEDLYHAALECEPGERAELLARADPELRGEVLSLLAQDSSKTGALDRPAWAGVTGLSPVDSTVALITPGTQLGPYKIEGPLAAGGMGQVFCGVDTRLGRPVAVKTSREQFSARFEREARTISSLNHPHICTLYDIGPNYLVMELCEGETLAARLKRGKLSVEETVRYGAQIADALAAAHAKGITHRDLKPGNVMLSKAGIKVLDFGLAKSPQDLTLTATSMVMGTPAYMAPEQREGKECDARTDIYALGLVLYEMATGKRTEAGQPQPVGSLPAELAPIVERCIAADPDDRWQSAKDLKAVLEWSLKTPAAPLRVKSRRSWITSSAIVLFAMVAAGALWGWWRAMRPPALRPLLRLEAEIPPETPFATSNERGVVAISSDGSRLALTLRGADGKIRLYTRLLRENMFSVLAGTENASSPFFSPDDQWIGFFADGKLKKISALGGGAITLCDAPIPAGASWGDDGNIVFTPTRASALVRVSSSGGAAAPLTKLIPPNDWGHRFPQVLPGSKAVLFTTHDNGQRSDNDNADIDVFSIKTGQRKTVQSGGYSGRYVATPSGSGRLIFLRHGTLFAAPFDIESLVVTGTPIPVIEKVTSGGGGGNFAYSSNGIFVYIAGEAQYGYWKIFSMDAAGELLSLDLPLAAYLSPRFSPDGKRLAFSIARGNGSDVWVKDLDRDAPSRLTFLDGNNDNPVWTPDGKNIVFHFLNKFCGLDNSGRAQFCDEGMFWIRSDGAGEPQRLTNGATIPSSISPNGRRLAFVQPGNGDIFTTQIEDSSARPRLGKPELFLKTRFLQASPRFSPDGRWLAYMSTESGMAEVYVRPFPGPGGQRQVSIGGGTFPTWSHDGHELLYQALDQKLMTVNYDARGDSFRVGRPRVWSNTRVMTVFGSYIGWDLAPDSKRVTTILQPLEGHLTFLLNFFDELERRVPASK